MKCRQATRLISDAQERQFNDQRKNLGSICTFPFVHIVVNFQRNCNTLRKLMKDFKG